MEDKNIELGGDSTVSRRGLLAGLGGLGLCAIGFAISAESKNQEMSGMEKISTISQKLLDVADRARLTGGVVLEDELMEWLENSARVDIVKTAPGDKLILAAQNSGIDVGSALSDVVSSSAGSLLYDQGKGWSDEVSVSDASMVVGVMTGLINQRLINDHRSVESALIQIDRESMTNHEKRDSIFSQFVDMIVVGMQADPSRPVNYIVDRKN